MKGLLQKEKEMYRGKRENGRIREAKYNKKYGEIVAKERIFNIKIFGKRFCR